MSPLAGVGLAVALLAANAFFVGAEFALISARRTQIEPRAAEGSRAARTTLRAMESVSLIMAGAQLGITACSLGLGAAAEPAIAALAQPWLHGAGVPDQMLHPIAFVIALVVVVYLHVVLGEMVPKNIAIAGPERAALVLGPPMMAVVTALRPLVLVLNGIANGVLRLLRVEPRDEVSSTFTREEVASMVDESRHEGLLGGDEYDRLAGALGFTERQVSSVLLPLDTLVSIRPDTRVREIEELCAETGYSRFPALDAAGELLGYLHVKDILQRQPFERLGADELRPLATVRRDQRLHEALSETRRRSAHMARVVDEEGRLMGIATLEDILEELVGEIRDAAHD